MAIEELLIDSADAGRGSNPAAALAQGDQARFPQVELARHVQAPAQEQVDRVVREPRLGLRVELERDRVEAPQLLDRPLDRRVALGHGRVGVLELLDRRAAPIALAIAVFLPAAVTAEVATHSAAVAEITLAPVAAEAVPAWAAVVLVAAEAVVAAAAEAVAVAAVAVAEEAVAVAAEEAGDEQFSNEINTYQIEIKHYELTKNFVTCLWNRYVSCDWVFIAGCVGN
jgi:hypothetical protein